jgi:teichoic acid transport system ATP-binding protein
MNVDVVIKARELGKCYKIWKSPGERFRSILLHGVKTLVPFTKPWCLEQQRLCYSEFAALQPISFFVRKGEVLGILGRNGSGKSTLLQLVAGILTPTTGEIDICGRVAALLELGSGFNPEFTGRENVFHNASILGLTDREIEDRYAQIVQFADIGDFINQPVKTYSSGMVVRLAFAVVAHIDADVLIIDEALAVGDAPFQAKCYQKFREARDRGCTILFVTHDTSTLVALCDRVIVLGSGRMVGDGDPKPMADLYRRICASGRDNLTSYSGGPESSLSSTLPRRAESQEYGSGETSITSLRVNQVFNDGVVKANSECDFLLSVDISASIPVAAPIVGFGFRDLMGNDLFGTNTWFEQHEIGPLRQGERRTIEFRFKPSLTPGTYLLCVACTEMRAEGLHVYHRLYDCALVQLTSTRKFVGSFDIRAAVSVITH